MQVADPARGIKMNKDEKRDAQRVRRQEKRANRPGRQGVRDGEDVRVDSLWLVTLGPTKSVNRSDEAQVVCPYKPIAGDLIRMGKTGVERPVQEVRGGGPVPGGWQGKIVNTIRQGTFIPTTTRLFIPPQMRRQVEEKHGVGAQPRERKVAFKGEDGPDDEFAYDRKKFQNMRDSIKVKQQKDKREVDNSWKRYRLVETTGEWWFIEGPPMAPGATFWCGLESTFNRIDVQRVIKGWDGKLPKGYQQWAYIGDASKEDYFHAWPMTLDELPTVNVASAPPAAVVVQAPTADAPLAYPTISRHDTKDPMPKTTTVDPAMVRRVSLAKAAGRDLKELGQFVLTFTPQHADGTRVLEKSFPGASLVPGKIVATTFATLAEGAAQVFRKSHQVDAVYGGCLSWARNIHYIGRKISKLDPAVGKQCAPMGITPLQIDDKDPEGPSIAGSCFHDPLECECLGKDVKGKVLLIGLTSERSELPTPAVVAALVERWGSVFTIVPNAAFEGFTRTISDKARMLSLPGDPEPVVIPTGGWFGIAPNTPIKVGGLLARKWLKWVKTPLGLAFNLVQFEVSRASPASTPVPLGALGSALMLRYDTGMAGGDVVYTLGDSLVRSGVVTEAERVASGRPMSADTYYTMERCATRVACTLPPHEILPADEGIAAARIAWHNTKLRRASWNWRSWFSDLVIDTDRVPGTTLTPPLSGLDLVLMGVGVIALGANVWINKDKWRSMSTTTSHAPATGMIYSAPGADHTKYALYAVFVAPWVEEAVKRINPYAKYYLIAAEATERAFCFGTVGLCAYFPVACMHLATAQMKYAQGVLLHSVWNFFALATAFKPPVLDSFDKFGRHVWADFQNDSSRLYQSMKTVIGIPDVLPGQPATPAHPTE